MFEYFFEAVAAYTAISLLLAVIAYPLAAATMLFKVRDDYSGAIMTAVPMGSIAVTLAHLVHNHSSSFAGIAIHGFSGLVLFLAIGMTMLVSTKQRIADAGFAEAFNPKIAFQTRFEGLVIGLGALSFVGLCVLPKWVSSNWISKSAVGITQWVQGIPVIGWAFNAWVFFVVIGVLMTSAKMVFGFWLIAKTRESKENPIPNPAKVA